MKLKKLLAYISIADKIQLTEEKRRNNGNDCF